MDEHRLMYELTTTPTDEETGAGRDFDPPRIVPRAVEARLDEYRWEMSGLARPIDADLRKALPKRVVFHTPRPRLYDFYTTGALRCLVSPRFRELLERLEPDTHEFVEIAVSLSQFPDLKLPPHYFLNIAKVNDGLDFDRCQKMTSPGPALPADLLAKYGKMPPSTHLSISMEPGPARGYVFNWDAIRGRHLFGVWHKLCPWVPHFLSQDFREACDRAGILGLAVRPCLPD